MLLEFKRCRHCGSEYEYQASGCGCRSPNNDKDYCPECMKIILEVLNKQPVKFTKRYMEIDNKSLIDELLKVKESVISKKKSGIMWPGVILITTPELSVLDYDNIELYEYQSKSYALCHNNNCDDLHLFVLQEYDLINNEFTKKYWNNKYGDKYESYALGSNWIRSFNKKIGKC